MLCLVVFIVAYVLEEDGKTGIEKKKLCLHLVMHLWEWFCLGCHSRI